MLRGAWEAEERSDESVVSYVFEMREQLERMMEHVKENLGKTQTRQK